jgi:hypothetical protein
MGEQLMSGRIYDLSGKATCKKCGRDMRLSSENNFNGPSCKSKKCDGSLLDAEYDSEAAYPGTLAFEPKKIEQDGEEKAQH